MADQTAQPRRCETCVYMTADDEACRRWPPSFGRDRLATGRSPWPTVHLDDWCGEWRLAAEPGEVEAMMRAVAIMDGSVPLETYTDKGRRQLKGLATMWLSAMRQSGLVPVIVPRSDDDLRWTQIDFDRDRIDFNPPGRKRTNKVRPIIAMPRRLRWFLLRAHARASSPYVLSYQGRKLASVKRSFGAARRRAGLGSDVVAYTLRHTAGTWLAQAGVSLWEIGGWLGHGNERTTELYGHHSPEFMKAARRVMD